MVSNVLIWQLGLLFPFERTVHSRGVGTRIVHLKIANCLFLMLFVLFNTDFNYVQVIFNKPLHRFLIFFIS